MTRAAIGVRVHSGWAALVAVSGGPGSVAVVDRRRVSIIDPTLSGAKQPYHFAKELTIPGGERHLAHCGGISERLAFESLRDIDNDLRSRGYHAAHCAILLAAGRPLPALPNILASHSLIHTAEGEFFRRAFWTAGERMGIRVTGVRERELDQCAQAAFGAQSMDVQREIAALGKTLGPPWTTDHKTATLAALLALAEEGISPSCTTAH